MNKCEGCGKILQSLDPSKEGYIPEKSKTKKVCQRCFKLMHYGVSEKLKRPKTEEEIINFVNNNAKEVFFITDFINICDRHINIYKTIKTKKTLIINKSDIIPKNISFGQIKNYIKKTYNINDIILFTNKNSNLNTLIKHLYKKEVYFLGVSNSGKSTILNNLLSINGRKKILSESFKENTTQDFICLKFDNYTVYDSPGFYMDSYELDKLTNISRIIRPISYKLENEGGFIIGDKIPIKIEGTTNLVFYFSNNIKVKRTKKDISRPEKIYVDDNTDIIINGLGFIKTTKKIILYVDKNMLKYINQRKSITGGKS